jgi:pilus biogenesis lipoprotein CpaD
MVEKLSRSRKSWMRLLAPAAALMALAACEAPKHSADYRDQSKFSVAKETVSLTFAVPAGAAELAGIEAAQFERFIRRYHEQGHGQMTVHANAAAAALARELLLKQGVRGQEIAVAPGAPAAADAVRLTYTASTAKVPDCEDWSSNATVNWSNRVHSNFGCATRRNLMLTVRNPADLEKAGDMSGFDGARGARVIENYRKAPETTGLKKETAKGVTTK